MADDTRDNDPISTTAPATPIPAAGPRRKLPKGIVLGKDGKPWAPLSTNKLPNTMLTPFEVADHVPPLQTSRRRPRISPKVEHWALVHQPIVLQMSSNSDVRPGHFCTLLPQHILYLQRRLSRRKPGNSWDCSLNYTLAGFAPRISRSLWRRTKSGLKAERSLASGCVRRIMMWIGSWARRSLIARSGRRGGELAGRMAIVINILARETMCMIIVQYKCILGLCCIAWCALGWAFRFSAHSSTQSRNVSPLSPEFEVRSWILPRRDFVLTLSA